MSEDIKMIVEIFDADGNLVEHHEHHLQPVSQEQIDAMIQLIDGGMPASMASSLIMSESGG